MQIAPFETEHFYARYEFTTPHQLCNSDCDTVSVSELMAMAGVPLDELGALSLGYTESPGDPTLREAIAEIYGSASANDVVVLATPIEGIYLLARALLEPGDGVVVLTPTYDALVNMFEHVVGSANVRRWSISPDEESWQLDFDALEGLIEDRTRLLVVNFPHNPTGFLPTERQLQRLSELADERGLHLFCDEMYHGLVHSGTTPVPSMVDLSDSAVVLSGLSKTHGLPGLRSGWLVVRDEALRANLLNWKFYTSICAPAPSEMLARIALSVRGRLRERNVEQIERNLELARQFFGRRTELFRFRPPLAGSTALVEMDVRSVSTFAHRMAEEAGVLIQPGSTLGASDRFFRMGFGRRQFAESLQHFDRYLGSRGL